MYTGFRFKAVIKNEYREDIKKVINDGAWKDCEHEELKMFDKVDRSFCIPLGAVCYMPDSWEESEDEKATDGFEMYFNEITGLLCFQCSLKNYKATIECFIENIIPVICENLIHCETLYEEDNVSVMYELNDGIVCELNYGIRYKDDESYSFMLKHNLINEDKNTRYENFDFTKENKYR